MKSSGARLAAGRAPPRPALRLGASLRRRLLRGLHATREWFESPDPRAS